MSYTVSWVEIRNVRSIEHLRFEFDPGGLTAIVGPTGGGKSTVMASILWCWLGEYRDGGLVQSDMRRIGAAENDAVSVECEGTINGARVRVKRSLRRRTSKGKSHEVAAADVWIDGEKQPNITPTSATALVSGLLGLDASGFVGAFYLPQAQLSLLADGTPSQVQDLIEDQTGLAVLAKKVRAASEQARAAERDADRLPGTITAIEHTAAELSRSKADAEDRRRVWQERDEIARQARADAAQLHEQARALTAAERAAQAASHAQTAAHTRLVDARTAAVDGLAAVTAAGLPTSDLAAAAAAAAARVDGHRRDLSAARDLDRRLTHAAADVQRAAGDVDRAHAGIADTATRDNEQDRAAAAAQIAHAEAALTTAVEDHARLLAEHDRTQRMIEYLESAGDRADCPTCRQQLHAGSNGLLAELRERIEQITREGKQKAEQKNHARAALNAGRAAAAARSAVRCAVSAAAAAHAEAKQRLAGADKKLGEVVAAIAQHPAAGAVAVTRSDAAAIVAQMVTDAEEQIAAAQQQQRLVQAAQHAADALRGAQQAADAADTALGRAEAPDTAQIERTQAAAARGQAEADRLSRVAADAMGIYRSADGEVKAARLAAEQAQQQWDDKQAAYEHAARLRGVHDVVKALREDLLAEYTDIISHAATDVLDALGGTHVGFEIGPDFVPRAVRDDGHRLPTRTLSGGEKAIASLAAANGLSDLITGGAGDSMLFVDEATAPLNEENRVLVTGRLRELGKPVVLISHTPEARDVATRVIEVAKRGQITRIVGNTDPDCDDAAASQGAAAMLAS